jgi:phospholipid/cholesterol/gamma-HCH transport system permease protein
MPADPFTIAFTDAFGAAQIAAACAQAHHQPARQVTVACAAVTLWPTARAAMLAHLLRRLERGGYAWSVVDVPDDVRALLEFFLYRRTKKRAKIRTHEIAIVEPTLTRTIRFLHKAYDIYLLLQDIVFWTLTGPFMRHGFRVTRSLYEVTERGVRSLLIVALVSFIMGLILALQAAIQLRKYGALFMIPTMVGVSIVYELGALMTAVLMAGRSGSSITAEIGTMVTSEEMDALRAMGVNITKYIIVPKFVALIIALPCLTVFADVIGIFGGYLISVLQIGMASADYIDKTINAVVMKDVCVGLTKSAADGVVIACISVYQGLKTSGGAEGIGKSTTRSVVYSIVMIAVAHLFFTALFYITGQGPMLQP